MGTVPSPATIVAGLAPPAADLNSFRDGVNWAQTNRPLALLRQQATQNLTTGTWAAITFAASSEDLDRDGAHSTTTNTSRYTALTPGWYRFAGGVEVAGGSGARAACFAKNGAFPSSLAAARGYVAGDPPASGLPSGNAFALVTSAWFSLNGTTDYVELLGLQSSGGTLATSLALGGSWMAVEWLGTA